MSGQRRRNQSRSKRKGKQPPSREFWGVNPTGGDGPAEEAAPAVEIRVSEDPVAMVASLGRPPLSGQDQVAAHYFTAVYEKAAMLANALAATAALPDAAPDQPIEGLPPQG